MFGENEIQYAQVNGRWTIIDPQTGGYVYVGNSHDRVSTLSGETQKFGTLSAQLATVNTAGGDKLHAPLNISTGDYFRMPGSDKIIHSILSKGNNIYHVTADDGT